MNNDDTPETQPAPKATPPLGILAPPTTEELMAYYNDPVRLRLHRLHNESRDLRKDQWKERFALIREAYSLLMPSIMESARHAQTVNPYFIDWDWSPIEYNAWCEIRGLALPFYPQVPVAGFFLDFADPYRKIGIELDGKEFHDAEKDAKRDTILSQNGWKIFRISGKMANTYMADELPEHLVYVDENGPESDDEEEERRSWDDCLRRTTIDGFFKWLKDWFYTREDIAEAANPTPDEDEEWEEEGGAAL